MVDIGHAVLAWTDNAIGETGYQIQMQVDNAAWATVSTIAGIAGNATTATTIVTVAPAMRDGRRYNFRVIAVDGIVVGLASTVATINLNNAPSQPVISAAVAGVGSVTVTWSIASNNAASIQVQSRTSNGTWITIATLPGNSVTYTNTNLLSNTRIQYRVRAANPNGSSEWSNASTSITVQ